jgi:hypothetical protein
MKYDEVIDEFLCNDTLREAMMHPCLIGEHVYATNGHIAIKIPVDKLNKTYKEYPGYPNIISIFAKRDAMFDKPKIFKMSAIETLLKEIPEENIEVECQQCEGTGESKDEKKCDQCAGRGNVLLLDTEYDWQNHKILIGKTCFNPNYIDKLLYVAGINDTQDILQLGGGIIDQNFFSIDEIEIVIMPMRQTDENGELISDSDYHELKEETNDIMPNDLKVS